MLDLNQFAKECHALSRAKGWYEGRDLQSEDTRDAMIELIHSELSEATECIRSNRLVTDYEDADGNIFDKKYGAYVKPCGLPSELADVVIRALDFKEAYELGTVEIKVHKYHFSDPNNANEKLAYIRQTRRRFENLITAFGFQEAINYLIQDCYVLADIIGFCLHTAILEKHAFNQIRPHRHGGKAA